MILDDTQSNFTCTVGPQSVGQHLTSQALCFGGQTMTATDVAISLGKMAVPGCHNPSGAMQVSLHLSCRLSIHCHTANPAPRQGSHSHSCFTAGMRSN